MELPSGFKTYMQKLLGDAEYIDFERAIMRPPTISVRGNKRKISPSESGTLFGMSASETGSVENVAWCDTGYYLESRPIFTLQPTLHAGAFYVQDASSMIYQQIIELLIKAGYLKADARLLDACAAPGGKTTAMINSLGNDSVVVANEYDTRRANILKENLCKWGFPNVIITQGDTSAFSDSQNLFDIVAVDAPCSGEGMMRKEDVAVSQWSPGLIEQCCKLQGEILQNVLPSLRPGGVLIYSTCTFNRLENEERMTWLVKEMGLQPIDLSLPEEWGIMSQIDSEYPAFRFMPHHTRGEGQFVAVLQKPADSEYSISGKIENRRSASTMKKNGKSDKNFTTLLAEVKNWISPTLLSSGQLVINGDNIRYLSNVVSEMLRDLPKQVRTINAGVEAAVIKGKNVIPAVGLALSGLYNPNHFPEINVTKQEAIAYLRHEPLILPQNISKGFALIKYENLSLGWVKNIGNRANNLYPQGWKIRITGE